MLFKKLTSIFLVFSLAIPANAASKVSSGLKCDKPGLLKSINGNFYKCTKSAKGIAWVSIRYSESAKSKIEWSKCEKVDLEIVFGDTTYACRKVAGRGLVHVKSRVNYDFIHSTDDGYELSFNNLGPLSPDLDIPPEWIEFQNAYSNWTKWNMPYRLKKFELGKARPKTNLTLYGDESSRASCKIEDQSNDPFLRGFTRSGSSENGRFNHKNFPNPNSVIQVVPIYASDTAKPTKLPEEDYGKYLNYVKNWIEYTSDVPTKVQIRYPKEYFNFPKPLAPYEISHMNPNWTIAGEILKVVDQHIDFSGSNMVVLVVPSGTSIEVMQQGYIGNWDTAEGRIEGGSTVYPDTYDKRSFAPDSKVKYRNLAHPAMWIHEFFHVGMPLDDHYGDQKNDLKTEYGMGWWSLMGPPSGDLLTWEKWFLGFINDSQVVCFTGTNSSNFWLAPTSVKSNEKKMLAIPLSKTKAIVVESIRAAGQYFKHPKKSWGALMYVVDVTKEEHGQGFKVILPPNRNPDTTSYSFLSEAPFRAGESVIYEGFRLEVVEAGNYGDVIKVEKV